MHDFHAVDVACGKLIKGHDILGVVILDFKQIHDYRIG